MSGSNPLESKTPMVSGVIRAIVGRTSPTRLCLFFVGCWLWAALGCSEIVGKVAVDRPRGPDDAGPAMEQPGAAATTACRAGDVRCQGQMLQACERDGSGWRPRERCESAALCVDSEGEQSRCVGAACEPGITCSGAELRECNSDRTGFELIDTCLSAAHCDAMSGACEQTRCLPGEITCNGATLQRCNDGPSGHDELATCATSALCDDLVRAICGADGQGCDASGAACPAPLCEVGELRCSGARLEACNAGRNGWNFVDECVTAGICERTRENVVAVSCVEPLCDVGDVICSAQGARLACNIERTEYSIPISQCRSADECTPDGCQVDLCAPGALSCNGNTLLACQLGTDGRPTRVAVDECATRQLCEQSLAPPVVGTPACAEPICAPAEFDCAGRQMQVCNAGRTDFVNRQLCVTDGLCEAGAGVGACPTPCSGTACNGSILRRCNAELTALVDAENCGAASQCDSVQGRCADPCAAGTTRCNGAALERCEDPLEGWQRLETCETAGLCRQSLELQQTACTARRCAAGQHRCTGQRLEVCNADLTDFTLVTTCAGGQICDAASQQCDVCASDAVACNGNTFSRCASNGQSVSTQQCGAGLCSATGPNVGCLECATPGGFRCDNQGSLFQCSADQQREDQLDVCRTPQLCRQNLGQCLDCDPPGSSRCDAAQVLGCSAQNSENVLQVCASADLCSTTGPTSAACDESECAPSTFQCTNQGEVLVCNAGQTGFIGQNPRVFCATPALCSATAAGGCQEPACQPGQRQCDGSVVEVCNEARTDYRAEQTCNTGGGFDCIQSGAVAACVCTPGLYRCVPGQGLSRCDGEGSAFVDVGADFACDGATRLSCSSTNLVELACGSPARCQASTAAGCAECVDDADCADDGTFCNGRGICSAGACASSGNPCAESQVCSEVAAACVACLSSSDCPTGQSCSDNQCVAGSSDGGT